MTKLARAYCKSVSSQINVSGNVISRSCVFFIYEAYQKQQQLTLVPPISTLSHSEIDDSPLYTSNTIRDEESATSKPR
jgi:hypothetical protein